MRFDVLERRRYIVEIAFKVYVIFSGGYNLIVDIIIDSSDIINIPLIIGGSICSAISMYGEN